MLTSYPSRTGLNLRPRTALLISRKWLGLERKKARSTYFVKQLCRIHREPDQVIAFPAYELLQSVCVQFGFDFQFRFLLVYQSESFKQSGRVTNLDLA